MAEYVNKPTLYVDFMRPARIRFDVRGNAIEGGRNGLGQGISIEMSGGGLVVADYESCFVHEREQHEYVNWLGAYANGSHRFLNVPLMTDWAGPFPTINGLPRPIITGIPHSDGSLFSDGSGYSQAAVYGEITADAALNAGVISMQVFGAARPLRWSDWFSIYHPTKGWRAYRYWRVNSKSSDSDPIYNLSIAPALREAVAAGTRVEFARPRFVAKFPSGFTLPWEAEKFWQARPSLSFVEAF
jgi:hypothetical protein